MFRKRERIEIFEKLSYKHQRLIGWPQKKETRWKFDVQPSFSPWLYSGLDRKMLNVNI